MRCRKEGPTPQRQHTAHLTWPCCWGLQGSPTRLQNHCFWNLRKPDPQGAACLFGKLLMAGPLPQPQNQIHLDSKKRKRDSPCFLQNSADS